jgi:hypothetical protein
VANNTIRFIVKPFTFIVSCSLLFYTACISDDTPARKNVNPDELYFDYKIRGEEKDSNITVYIRYRMGGPNGTTLALSEPAKVQLDGEIITVDSAKLAGAFYDIQKPSKSFPGKHIILFTDFNNKEYNEEFEYKPFKLKTKIPAVINRGDLAFDFEGLEAGDYIRVAAIDTSFMSRDIHEIDTPKNGQLLIPADKLKNLISGPIILLLSKETERPVRNGTKVGGRIAISYGMQREFELK